MELQNRRVEANVKNGGKKGKDALEAFLATRKAPV